MRIEIIYPGKTKDKYYQKGIDEYVKRLGRYAKVSVMQIKEFKGAGNDTVLKEKEGQLLLSKVHKSSFLVVLDPAGNQQSSEAFADSITQWEELGKQAISFIVGGPLGLSGEVLDQADLILSLSEMTFTHDMARLLLLEQIYRAYTIKAGTAYHK
ncbi:MAG: 23S rRNA (pseudouridine(1915)-N(3))-methyltransferase RlmH [Desulfobulbaceae bacterium]|uniref:Ribosomal RNA large subunit methyltransferase H n=1 Tax=Candidatus Desulfobia pelagia TaxID=2841692 RepID=A0A8J6NFV1_9BACT|nr:23S rRNA (pseudouridine(1915)-N(3))-methyltransferase RlmH [Candidatus Desulfobia pelagia]